MTSNLYERVSEAAAAIRARAGDEKPAAGLILGSGLGGYADTLEAAVAIPYAEIPHFPTSTVAGHAGQLVIGRKQGVLCAAMQGRVHYYEGHSARDVAFPARVLAALGADTFIITNAAGGIDPSFEPGTLMLIRDHLNLIPDNPLRGDNDERLGPRFPDMTRAYAPELRELARAAAQSIGVQLAEGVYAALPGPSYETPAEVKMLGILGASAAGMSTAPETIVANHMGKRVLGVSCITNKAAGVTGEALSHEEVTETAARVRETFSALLDAVLASLDGEGGGA
jgi:purine-nucleoside phosphorylase